MNTAKIFYWTIVVLFVCRPGSLKRFRTFCTKIDGVSESEWASYEQEIRENSVLRNYFNLKQAE